MVVLVLKLEVGTVSTGEKKGGEKVWGRTRGEATRGGAGASGDERILKRGDTSEAGKCSVSRVGEKQRHARVWGRETDR